MKIQHMTSSVIQPKYVRMERSKACLCSLRLLVFYSTAAFVSYDVKVTLSLSLQGCVGGEQHQAACSLD